MSVALSECAYLALSLWVGLQTSASQRAGNVSARVASPAPKKKRAIVPSKPAAKVTNNPPAALLIAFHHLWPLPCRLRLLHLDLTSSAPFLMQFECVKIYYCSLTGQSLLATTISSCSIVCMVALVCIGVQLENEESSPSLTLHVSIGVRPQKSQFKLPMSCEAQARSAGRSGRSSASYSASYGCD